MAKSKTDWTTATKKTKNLLKVVARLRKECPWDRKQTHISLIPYLLEESYEAIEAIQKHRGRKGAAALREELGDVLLQIVLHSEIARERRDFDFGDVVECITEKMVRRHPHVFGSTKIRTAEEQVVHWSKLKQRERGKKSLLEGTPKAMPALQLAQRYGEVAASVNFDWANIAQVIDKVEEEFSELKQEIRQSPRNRRKTEMELGDLLFAITRLASHLKLNAEEALKKSSGKFENRFHAMEQNLRRQKKELSELKLSEWQEEWIRAKRRV